MTFDEWKFTALPEKVRALSVLGALVTFCSAVLAVGLIGPLIESYDDLQEAIDRSDRVHLALQGNIDAGARLRALEEQQNAHLGLLRAESSALAAAELQRKVQDVILENHGSVRAVSTGTVEHLNEGLVELQVDISFDIAEPELIKIIQELEYEHVSISVRNLFVQHAPRSNREAGSLLSLKMRIGGFYSPRQGEEG